MDSFYLRKHFRQTLTDCFTLKMVKSSFGHNELQDGNLKKFSVRISRKSTLTWVLESFCVWFLKNCTHSVKMLNCPEAIVRTVIEKYQDFIIYIGFSSIDVKTRSFVEIDGLLWIFRSEKIFLEYLDYLHWKTFIEWPP